MYLNFVFDVFSCRMNQKACISDLCRMEISFIFFLTSQGKHRYWNRHFCDFRMMTDMLQICDCKYNTLLAQHS